MTRILIATGNIGKAKEIREVLDDLKNIEFVSLQNLNLPNDAEETGATYEENSLIKARHFFAKTGLVTLAEDSGIEVEALKEELGVKTRRWGAGEQASDEEWLRHFLERMRNEKNRRAKFVCVSTIVWSRELEIRSQESGVRSQEFFHTSSELQTPNFEFRQFRGETWGILLDEPQGEIPHGIPVSAVFVADGTDRVYQQLGIAEKNKISHRGKAMHAVKDFLQEKFV